MGYILSLGSLVIIALLLMFYEHEKASRDDAASAQSEADASVYAVAGQGTEITNIPPGGELPANLITEANNTTINQFVGLAN